MSKVIAISMNKGGVGKTSLVTNLAAAISSTQPKKKVLILDTDAQGNAAISFGRKPADFSKTIYDVLVGEADISETKIRLTDNLDLVPANKDMDFIDFDVLPDREKYPQPLGLLKPAIHKIREEYDYILIDSPPSLSLVAGNILACADMVVIPFAPEMFAVQGLIRVIDVVMDFKKKTNPQLQLAGIVGMMVDTRTTLHSEMLQKARQYCVDHDYRMFDTIIPRSIRFASSTAYEGKPAVWTDKSNPIVAAYFELLDEVMEHVGA